MTELGRGFDDRLRYLQQQLRDSEHYAELEFQKFRDQLSLAGAEIVALQDSLNAERKMSLHNILKLMGYNATDVGFLLGVLNDANARLANWLITSNLKFHVMENGFKYLVLAATAGYKLSHSSSFGDPHHQLRKHRRKLCGSRCDQDLLKIKLSFYFSFLF